MIQRVTGRRPTNMRPPYGAINERVRQSMIRDHGLDVIMWSCDPLDWKRPGASVVAQRMVDGAAPGESFSRTTFIRARSKRVPGVSRVSKPRVTALPR